jgi:hypothetical protein
MLFMRSACLSRAALAAENLFLRKQLAFYQEHKLRPRPLTDAARFTLALWSRLFDWTSDWLASERFQAALALEVSHRQTGSGAFVTSNPFPRTAANGE